jgi:DNA-binding PadR family transcriptional regulator
MLMPRRKQNALLPIEASVLEVGIELWVRGTAEFHGFLIAKQIQEQQEARLLTAHGTLYKALDRMERAGWLSSRWEDPVVAAEQRRPRRRLYRVTAAGETALAKAREARPVPATKLEGRLAPS